MHNNVNNLFESWEKELQAVNTHKSFCQSYWQRQFTGFFAGHSQYVQNWHARKFYFLRTYSLSQKIGISHHWDEQKLQFLHTYFSPEARDIDGFFI